MENQDLERLVRKYFPAESEMLSDEVLRRVIEGYPVETISVKGAHQLDLSGTLLIIKTAIDALKFVYDIYKDNKAAAKDASEAVRRFQEKYPELYSDLGDEAARALVNDIRSV